MVEIRRLKKSEIECRVSTSGVKKNGVAYASYLLYKDARVDMKILDETFGPLNWQREHTLIGDRLYCTISIYDPEKGEWIRKQDVGTESYAEKEKGQASDSFKRAGFNVGIGRELYTAPNIFVDLEAGEFSTFMDQKTQKEKVNPRLDLYVDDIDYSEEGCITLLVLKDKRGKVRYSFGSTARPEPVAQSAQTVQQPVPAPPPAKKRMKIRGQAWTSAVEKHATGTDMTDAIEERYALTEEDWETFFADVNEYKRANNIQ